MEPMHRGVYIDGRERPGGGALMEVRNPWDDSLVGTVATANSADVAEATAAAERVFRSTLRTMPVFERARILRAAAAELRAGRDELEAIVVAEAGKAVKDVRRELGRAASVLELAADYAMTMHGELVPLDVVESGINRLGMARRVPVGVVAAITPSNSPVNITLNKVAPAIAAGNAVVVKTADQTPFSGLWIAEAFTRAGLPDGAYNVVIGSVDDAAEPLVKDDRVRMVTITGSVPAGLAVARNAGVKKVTLELGSSAANVVRADADIAEAANSLVYSAFLNSGQACISAQRIFVHESVVDEFLEHFVPRTEALIVGDPADPATEVGPMVSQAHADRVLGWISEAIAAGARAVTGGVREGRTIRPTLLADVPADVTISSSEVFSPVAILTTFSDDDEVIAKVNDSVFGLQAAVFTRDITAAFRFADEMDAGAIWINDSSRYRQDNYPFGGMKLSGVGREGIKYAIEDMTEMKFVGVKLGPNPGLL